ncbi:cytochrome c oxidase cbb3-type subunit 2 [Algoriphagus ratkowskyi]|uniref:C-type cytochrome n=1 Tax=Algoriphagus ratkowskyi TaxID=57028 RepID=A0A2W7R8Y6_9BACT|nr:cbb3-type cytochrome c oxidase subunit II [Algoriphagus ratkowskyi]PZX50679.1 cytochrome c oxidase cbb3-type subunit 2 [Algoriphagus ratkowskyi]TXD80033.1 c-type cytochrome [Algoriphagus ratkowskyi]
MFNFHKNLNSLVLTAFLVFLGLSMLVSVIPAFQLQKTEPLPTMTEPTEDELQGLRVYVGENCMACHTQQVRNIEMDQTWGDRPSIPSDYYYSKQRMNVWQQSPSVLGSERTGPDLTNIGKRQPGQDWHLMHLYNPRIVVKESIMPGYPWMFEEKSPDQVKEKDVIVSVPSEYLSHPDNKVVASKQVMQLVNYLQSLKQSDMPGMDATAFIPSTKKKIAASSASVDGEAVLPDGLKLYDQTCAACHQSNGQGIPGAFPSIAGSQIVNDDNPETLIRIVLQGYDARPEFGAMPSFAAQLSDEEIAAILNHERSSWGNSAKKVTAEQVTKIRELVEQSVN